MDFTILAVVLLIGVGIPVRNKLIRKYREKRSRKIRIGMQNDGYEENRVHPFVPSVEIKHGTKSGRIPS